MHFQAKEKDLAGLQRNQLDLTLYFPLNTFTQKLSRLERIHQANLDSIASLKHSNLRKPSPPSEKGLHKEDQAIRMKKLLSSVRGLHQNFLTMASRSAHIPFGSLKKDIP
jgi:hypothetical protein